MLLRRKLQKNGLDPMAEKPGHAHIVLLKILQAARDAKIVVVRRGELNRPDFLVRRKKAASV